MIHRLLLAVSFACLLPFSVFAEAPVVDDSENYALLDQQQAAVERPVAHEESALARDHEEISSNSNGDNGLLLDKLKSLQQDVQELRGQLEVQAHDLKLLQEQQLAFYKDLDARLRNDAPKIAKNEPRVDLPIAAKPAVEEPAVQLEIDKTTKAKPQQAQPIASNPVRSNPADEQISYLAAYELVQNKHFDEAMTAMQSFVTHYPQGGYTANAQYWLGELYMVKKNYPEAIKHFEVVLQQFPSSSKSAASMLKIGYALAASGKKNEAIQHLQKVVKNYPDTNTAQLALAKLESLNS